MQGGWQHFADAVRRGTVEQTRNLAVLENRDWGISSRSKLPSPISYYGNADNSRQGTNEMYTLFLKCLVSTYR